MGLVRDLKVSRPVLEPFVAGITFIIVLVAVLRAGRVLRLYKGQAVHMCRRLFSGDYKITINVIDPIIPCYNVSITIFYHSTGRHKHFFVRANLFRLSIKHDAEEIIIALQTLDLELFGNHCLVVISHVSGALILSVVRVSLIFRGDGQLLPEYCL